MSFSLPPIVKLAERLLVDIEQAVRGFARYHKYAIGADLRREAMKVVRLTHRAWRQRNAQLDWTRRLVKAVDNLKITLQIGSRIHAFRSFGQFEAIARVAADLGRQAGGWLRQQLGNHPKGQSAAAATAPQRAQILSTRDAPIGATP